MINKILGTVFLVASGAFNTYERTHNLTSDYILTPNKFMILFATIGVVLFIIGMTQDRAANK